METSGAERMGTDDEGNKAGGSNEKDSGRGEEKISMKVCGMSPYWIDRSSAIPNDLDLDGLFLLTGRIKAHNDI